MVVDGRMIANQPYFRLVEFSMDFSPQHIFGIFPKSYGTEAFHIGISHSTDTKNCGWPLSLWIIGPAHGGVDRSIFFFP